MDPPLGDVLIENAGVTRLIAFKREQNDSMKEETKRLMLERILGGNARLQSVSREILQTLACGHTLRESIGFRKRQHMSNTIFSANSSPTYRRATGAHGSSVVRLRFSAIVRPLDSLRGVDIATTPGCQDATQ